MKDTYKKYTLPEWNAQGCEKSLYIPDHLLDALLDHLKTHPDSPLNAEYGERQTSVRDFLRLASWDWEESVGFVLQLWKSINPACVNRLKNLQDGLTLNLSSTETGHGGGACYEDHISFWRDGTINDPVYLAHETGHLMGHFQKETHKNIYANPNIAELQGYFAQELAYRRIDRKLATLPHRWMDYSGALSRIPSCLWQIDEVQKKDMPYAHHQTLRDVFHAWSFHDEKILDRDEKWLKNQGTPPVNETQNLHHHPFAALLAPAMVDKYEAGDYTERQKLVGTLYGEPKSITLNEILDAFGLNTPGKMCYAVNTCLKYLKAAEPLL